jgi:chemosensory pili system protein ChpA (sensor histidine kinase/response regulator)
VAETVLQQQARINTDLQEGLMRTRMVHFSTQAARLRAIVRQTGRELDKRVDLDLGGSDVELDRTVLERMIGPFEHMIRNSIDHGIETEAERRQRGKPATGQIIIATAQEGSEIVIRFSDDGAGLNISAIRAKAVERGLAHADANLTEDEMVQFILMPGFSTAEKVTHLSGRGVGMDVVHTEVKQLGGSMSVETKRGAGTTFTIRLPLTLSIAQALMVYVGDQQFAVPLAAVANIIEFPVEKLASLSVGKNPLLNYQEQVYPYMHLGQRFGINTPALRNAATDATRTSRLCFLRFYQ